MTNYVIKNAKHAPCRSCTEVHEYISKGSQFATCGTPIAFSREGAEKTAEALGISSDNIIETPDDTYVVLDDSARQLPKGGGVPAGGLERRTIIDRVV